MLTVTKVDENDSLQSGVKMDSLQRLTKIITGKRSLQDALQSVTDETTRLFGADTGLLLLFSPRGSVRTTFQATSSTETGMLGPSPTAIQQLVGAFKNWSQTAKASALVAQSALDPNWQQLGSDVPLMRSALVVPVVTETSVPACLAFISATPDQFNANQQAIAEMIGVQVALKLENATVRQQASAERSILRAIVGGGHDAVLVTDLNNRLLLANKPAQQSLSIPGDAVGNPINYSVTEPAILNFFQAFGDEEQITREIELNDGRVFDCALVQLPNVGKVLSMHDISTFKHLDEMKNEFVSQVAHDLKAPLGVIYGYGWLLNEVPKLNPEEKEYVVQIINSVERMRSLIENILDIGRIEMGISAEFEVTEIPPVIRSVMEQNRPIASQKEVNLTSEIHGELPLVFGADMRLELALNNLVGNALKFTPSGGLVTIEAESKGDKVIVHVKDTGPGIPKEQQNKLFEKFTKLKAGGKNAEGHGLGLAIVKSIIEAHEGEVWVESEVGKGSTFSFSLPVHAILKQEPIE